MRKLLSVFLALGTSAMVVLIGVSPARAAATQSVTTVRYGPFTIPAGTMDKPGEIENRILLGVAKPCIGCYITSMAPDLVYPDGSNANVDTGVMLHHTLLSSGVRADPTCGRNLLGLIGQRFFAAGNERTVVAVAPGYGYYVPFLDSWNMVVDLMNESMTAKTVYISIAFTYTRTPQTRVTPVWLDIDQCGDSEYAVPAGMSDRHWDWRVNVPGRIVGIGGHVHDDGVRTEATNETTGRSICNSVGRYGESPEFIDDMGMAHLSSMSRCIADPVATVTSGQIVRIHSVYDAMEAMDDVMGIMIAFVA